MTHGHGDDKYRYANIRINFSSNVVNCFCHDGLFHHLSQQMTDVLSYPEPTPVSLERELAVQMDVRPSQVSATNGATEAIYLIAQAWRGSCSAIVAPTFSEYADACLMHGHKVTYIHDLQDIPYDADLVWLCCPNNPTGTVTDVDLLRRIIHQFPHVLFVVDASYAAFTLRTLLSPAEACGEPNVLMLHSMTKEYAVPGLRIGYVTACESLIERLASFRMPWSVNQLAICAANYLLAHPDDYHIDLPKLLAERQRVADELSLHAGIEVHPSDTHILLCRLSKGTAAELKERLAHQHGILIRDASNFVGLTPAHFRIAVQSKDENDELINKLRIKGGVIRP